MQITFFLQRSSEFHNLDVDENETIDNIKAVLEVETSVPMNQQELIFNGIPITSSTPSLKAAGVVSGDMVTVKTLAPPVRPQSRQPAQQEGQTDWRSLFTNALSTAGQSISRILPQQQAPAPMDAMDPEFQRRLELEIQQKNVMENLENAIEYAPEAFARVYMLYINCSVNGQYIKAFVDSGAQVTIMSKHMAEKCGLMRLLDIRFAGEARGVGVGKILGRIHLAPIEIGGAFFNCSFSVMEDASMDLLFGLDMLKAHQCIIDLNKGRLHIGTAGIFVDFLSENELPPHARLTYESPLTQPTPAPALASSQPSQGGRRLGTAAETTTLPPSVPAASVGSINEGAVQQIVALGFSREEAVEALKRAGGNADIAAALLFG